MGGITFEREFNCSDVTFHRFSVFDQPDFAGGASFLRAEFKGTSLFDGVSFGPQAVFENATFSADSSFDGSSFGDLDLTSVKFDFPAVFTRSDIHQLKYTPHVGERLSFNSCNVVELNGVPGTLDFKSRDCSRLAFLNMDLSRADFLGADVSETHFISCTWKEPDRGHYTPVFGQADLMKKGGAGKLRLLEGLYSQLKTNLIGRREFAQAGDFHYWEMEIRHRRLVRSGTGSLERALLYLYGIISDFGESYLKLFAWLGGSVGISALLVASIQTFGRPGRWGGAVTHFGGMFAKWFDACGQVLTGVLPFYGVRSTASETTEALEALSRVIIGVEGIVLYVFTALFLMAIARRFRR